MRIVALFLLSVYSVFALKLEDISETMQKNINESLRILEQEKTDKTKSANKIFTLFDGIFDYDFMAKLSLSTRYEMLSATEKKQYNEAFEANLKKSFTDKLSLYNSQKLKVVNLKEEGKRVF
ncbi:ABC transporter substrate-binding protein, partial [Campylobacter sp.]|uniref:ABC transporter substrate-binding protein n=1 Tax=Campylobacter sp. TaxID=205 RepID=UPI0025BF4AE9